MNRDEMRSHVLSIGRGDLHSRALVAHILVAMCSPSARNAMIAPDHAQAFTDAFHGARIEGMRAREEEEKRVLLKAAEDFAQIDKRMPCDFRPLDNRPFYMRLPKYQREERRRRRTGR